MRASVFCKFSLVLLIPLVANLVLAEVLPQFPAESAWRQNISAAAVHPDSAKMLATVDILGGFGGNLFKIDFSMRVVHADASAPTMELVSKLDAERNPLYYADECDELGTMVPVPRDAAIEGEEGMRCESGGDCHYLVTQGNLLFEMYQANVARNRLQARCLATWHLDTVYPEDNRGDHCTSADAGGLPIAPLLFNADEIQATLALDPTGEGDLNHAIRFILPNARIARDAALGGRGGRLYVRPASHAGGPVGPASSVPYGAHLRLRGDFPLDNYSPAARVILNTLKRYGMVLADGGDIALTAESDYYTTAKWVDLGIDANVFARSRGNRTVRVSDFEVLDTGPRIAETYDCKLAPAPAAGLVSQD
jgi:serine/threonine-protein kinase